MGDGGGGGDAQHGPLDVLKTIVIFLASGLAEIGGGWLVWKASADFGRSYAAYGGLFIAMSVLWGWALDKQRPDKWDLVGGLVAIVGASIMFFAPRPAGGGSGPGLPADAGGGGGGGGGADGNFAYFSLEALAPPPPQPQPQPLGSPPIADPSHTA
eukprot:tig00000219_g19481.t1